MKALFLDASGWYAALQPREASHAQAREQLQVAATSGVRLVTTSLVVAEMHAMFVRRTRALAGQRFLDSAFDTGACEIDYPTRDTCVAARDRWIHKFQDHPISLCDAVSFEVMRRERITHALTIDRHFAIAGFEILG